jgi:hypothetical protein
MSHVAECQRDTSQKNVRTTALRELSLNVFSKRSGAECFVALEQTYDANLEVVAWSAQQRLLLLGWSLFGRHFLLSLRCGSRRERVAGRRPEEKTEEGAGGGAC